MSPTLRPTVAPKVPRELTKNQALVFGALDRAEGPMTAYSILDQLRDEGFRAPPQVYRALDKLIQYGLVHRLETLNAFVACRHPECEDQEIIAFTICETCAFVTELTDPSLTRTLKRVADQAEFSLREATVELRGICAACKSRGLLR